MKKSVLVFSMLFIIILGACSIGGGEASTDTNASDGSDGQVTELTHWGFTEKHAGVISGAVEKWNEENPDRLIKLNSEVYPYDQMHNNLLLALQSGKGAPDLADIEINKFPNFLKGNVQLLPLNEELDPYLDKVVVSRYENYAKDGNYYGLATHVGASVMYYNKKIMEEAGIDIDSIVTWDDFSEAGEKVVENTDSVMTTFETGDLFGYWAMVSQQDSDFISSDGKVTLDNETNINTLQFMQNMVKEGIAVLPPGGNHHAEEYYGFMSEGGAATVSMPIWYMNRFTEYMPNLKGEIAIRPLPVWEEGGKRSAGMGGTGTAVTNQTDHAELAKDFLAYAMLSKEGNLALWRDLGVDPPRWDIWDSEEMKEDNEYFQYFGGNVFEMLLEIQDEVNPLNISDMTPDISDQLTTNVFNSVLRDQSQTPEEALKQAAEEVRRKHK